MRLRLITIIALLAQILIGFQGAAPVAATPRLNTTFFNDDFEAATLGINWTTSVTGSGSAALSTNYPHSGTKSMFVGNNAGGNATAALVFAFDLTRQTDVFLDFWVRATGGTPYGTARTMSVSDNGGSSWTQILDLTTASQNYSHLMFDLASVAATKGLALNSQFRISFNYSGDNHGLASDGLAIDDLRLNQRAQATATSPLAQDSFDTASLQPGFYTQNWNGGVAELSTNYPHSGTQSVLLHQKVAGNADAALILALDLSNQTDVVLDFWSRGTGGYPYATTRTVSISDNGGSSWNQILDLTSASQSFSHEVIDLASEAATKGFALNNQFLISFNYYADSHGMAGDGFVIDDVRLTQRAQAIASFPFGPETFESATVQQGLYPQSGYNGVAEINTSYPHGGAKSMFLGQKVAGSSKRNAHPYR